jgi:hypothetical protein
MVIFNQNYVCSIPLQNLLVATYLVYYLSLFGPYVLEKGFTDFLQIFPNFFWHLQVYIFVSKLLIEV